MRIRSISLPRIDCKVRVLAIDRPVVQTTTAAAAVALISSSSPASGSRFVVIFLCVCLSPGIFTRQLPTKCL